MLGDVIYMFYSVLFSQECLNIWECKVRRHGEEAAVEWQGSGEEGSMHASTESKPQHSQTYHHCHQASSQPADKLPYRESLHIYPWSIFPETQSLGLLTVEDTSPVH